MQAYTGETRDDTQVALLRGRTYGRGARFRESNNWNGTSSAGGTGKLSVVRIDGEKSDRTSWIELLAGRHDVEWAYVDAEPGLQRKTAGKCSFDAQAGHIYSLFFGEVLRSTKVLVSVTDITDTTYAEDGRQARAKHVSKQQDTYSRH